MTDTSVQRPSLGIAEFIALMAMLTAIVAFAIEAMLPALPQIAGELTSEAPNRAQLIVTSFVFGMGLGTFFVGPLSDSYGRKPVVLWGSALFMLASALAWMATSLEMVIAARVLQGLGASAARIVPMAITRDYFAGREMARINSIILMVFTLVPAIAPLLGSYIIALAGWRGIFASLMLFSFASAFWLALRVAEPLPPGRRRPFRARPLKEAVREVLANPVVRRSTFVLTLCYVALFASLSSIHPIFETGYERGASFPYWFALLALTAGGFSLLNAALVVRLGMRRLVRVAMAGLVTITLMLLIYEMLIGPLPFLLYFIWQIGVFINISMTLGNLTAIALEPMGHLAGTATSVTSAIATVGSVVFSIPISLMFDGTALPLMIGVLVAVGAGLILMRGLGAEYIE
ncbi:multidrug effflux MFS transporter [Roseovarius sp. 2305UL8-3]|uniref:multidrug effflux MFS transporter n=1 Tax=Roseovarius conchicola TaxID=3121636 RepID=UPI00352755E6